MSQFMRIEDLDVYRKLCHLHIDVCGLTKAWPVEERYELASQIRRSSNSAPAQLAEKHSDRHVRNKIKGVNRARGESLETVHHLYMGHLKRYLDLPTYNNFRERYLECVRMLNGLEKTLERRLPPESRRWPSAAPDTATPDPLTP